MKKFYYIGIMLILMLSGVIIYKNFTYRINLVNTDRIIIAKSFDELEEKSNLIIEGTVQPEKQNILDKLKDGTINFGYTITKIKVDRVIKGDLKAGEIVSITEEYYTVGRDIYVQGNYIPAKEGKKYILYLTKYDEQIRFSGLYFPTDLEKGKYLVFDKEINVDIVNEFTNSEM